MSTETPTRGEYVVRHGWVDDKGKAKVVLLALANLEEPLTFAAGKATAGLRVGHVYSIPVVIKDRDTQSFVFGNKTWVREFEDKDKVLEWQAAQKAADIRRDALRLEAKEATSTSGLDEALEPIRRAYLRLPYPHRAAFEVYVLATLRRGTL